MNEVQTEPAEVQPGSPAAEMLTASVEEKFAAPFRQVHPPVMAWEPHPAFEARLALETSGEEVELVPGMTAEMSA